ncbi:MAG: phosphate signaling complex protein PhoU [Lachnospiraceae bacterium]|uniref:phosphate signaling complex protein PhoU n=1 Tax=Roseburia hominis TaxID=301301 RepID=UPI001F411CEF|nr:phosphate signaling complex protein PhoU [Roseburia hominis]MCI5713910.1 phosphate signaling complex protein PhoU [Lachnospiraceae bacterium]MDD6170636.1 phosphate signaling complex protein PhoU [Lachnospiraceae bacterium]
MRNRFDRELIHLNDELIEMGSLIEKAIEKAISALVNKDVKLAQDTIEMDEEIDDKEREIEHLCLKLLLQQQPVAKDLRVISSALKMITDMERIGDQASDISEITIQLADQKYIKELETIQNMAKEASVMLVKSIEAFVNKDVVLAGEVIGKDDVVDDLFMKVKSELIELISQNTDNGEQATDFLMIAKYLERIGDHATNISEWVIFSITGEHKSEK